jgi:ABC-type transporter MlaC component
MARLSVGPSSWATMSESQRQPVIDGFGRYISAINADRFDSYAGQKLQVTDEQPAAAGVMVHSQIVKANGEPVKVDFSIAADVKFQSMTSCCHPVALWLMCNSSNLI